MLWVTPWVQWRDRAVSQLPEPNFPIMQRRFPCCHHTGYAIVTLIILLLSPISCPFFGNTSSNRNGGIQLSYRDYIEAQKKYIETKKQALLDENGRDRCQRPYGDPPPAGPKWWVIAGVTALILLPAILFCFTARIPALAEDDTLTLAVLATEAEFMQIKSWLDPEILANGLTWKIEHYPTRRNL